MGNWNREMKHQGKNISDLAKRLRSILPEYRPISEFAGRSGTYKAVDADGNVYLVTWTIHEDKIPHRAEQMIMDAQKFMTASEEAMVWFKPDEGWRMEF